MRTVAEFRKLAEERRELAKKLTREDDKKAMELMAKTWEKAANARERELRSKYAGYASIIPAGGIWRPRNVLQYLPLHAWQLGNVHRDASSRQPPQSSAFVSVIGGIAAERTSNRRGS